MSNKESPFHNHPVRISYQTAFSRDPGGYVPPSILDERVKLIEGEVHCVSCHAVAPPGRWTLVKSNSRSALCLSCHRK
jgi:predicted CXXCH cytochrome family protein